MHHHHHHHPKYCHHHHGRDELRLEAVIVSVGFDDFLDITLGVNHHHFDTVIVVSDHADRATHAVANKHGAILVQTDLFAKNGRAFNKGAAINSGFHRYQYHGWRMVLDADIALPDSFRRTIFNHTTLDKDSIYGADRVDVVGKENLKHINSPQHSWRAFVSPGHPAPISPRYMDPLYGYVPIGFFQLWHANAQKDYPYSLGTAAHDDVAFAAQWPANYRKLLPSVICYHLCSRPPSLGENWDGHRKQPRL